MRRKLHFAIAVLVVATATGCDGNARPHAVVDGDADAADADASAMNGDVDLGRGPCEGDCATLSEECCSQRRDCNPITGEVLNGNCLQQSYAFCQGADLNCDAASSWGRGPESRYWVFSMWCGLPNGWTFGSGDFTQGQEEIPECTPQGGGEADAGTATDAGLPDAGYLTSCVVEPALLGFIARGSGACNWDSEVWRAVCLYPLPGHTAPKTFTGYTRVSDLNGAQEVMFLESDLGPIANWSSCQDVTGNPTCGCSNYPPPP